MKFIFYFLITLVLFSNAAAKLDFEYIDSRGFTVQKGEYAQKMGCYFGNNIYIFGRMIYDYPNNILIDTGIYSNSLYPQHLDDEYIEKDHFTTNGYEIFNFRNSDGSFSYALMFHPGKDFFEIVHFEIMNVELAIPNRLLIKENENFYFYENGKYLALPFLENKPPLTDGKILIIHRKTKYPDYDFIHYMVYRF